MRHRTSLCELVWKMRHRLKKQISYFLATRGCTLDALGNQPDTKVSGLLVRLPTTSSCATFALRPMFWPPALSG